MGSHNGVKTRSRIAGMMRGCLRVAALGSMAWPSAHADDIDAKLKLIREQADAICMTVPIEGSEQKVELSAGAEAKLDIALRKIADLGVDGSAKFQSDTYRGVLRQELAAAIKSGNDCKLTVFQKLTSILFPQSPSPTVHSSAVRPNPPARQLAQTGYVSSTGQPPRDIPNGPRILSAVTSQANSSGRQSTQTGYDFTTGHSRSDTDYGTGTYRVDYGTATYRPDQIYIPDRSQYQIYIYIPDRSQ